jgi:membrane protease subunit (stomatin/prohibitin family)
MGKYTTAEIEEYLKQVIVSRFNDYLGENLDSLLSLPGRYDEISRGLYERLKNDFSHFGLALEHLYTASITPPPEVQKAIDDKSRLGAIKDLDGFVKMKAAMAMEKAAESTSEAGSGMGMGMGFMMPAMFADMFTSKGGAPAAQTPREPVCPDCGRPVSKDAKFCPYCGHQQVVFNQCTNCGKNLPPNAKFCPRCGTPSDKKPVPKICPACKSENLPGSVFCNQCGERLA